MKNITFTDDQIKKIYEVSYTISESIGKNRQNIINDVVIESLKSDVDRCLIYIYFNLKYLNLFVFL